MTEDDRAAHERLRTDLGGYLLGSLSAADRAAVQAHLTGCAQCRAELAGLAPLPGLLGLISTADARSGALTPGPGLLPRTLAAVRERQHSDRRTLLRWRLAASAAAVIAVAVGVLPQVVTTGPERTALTAAAGVTATGLGGLDPRPWGTAVELDLARLPLAPGYVAYALARDGHGEIAATWSVTPDGHAKVTGATGIARSDLAAIEVRTADGRPVLTLPA